MVGELFGLRNGIAHAETHAEMFRDNNFHLLGRCATFTRRTPLPEMLRITLQAGKPVRSLVECFDGFINFVLQSLYAKKFHFFPVFTICSKTCRYSRNAPRPFAVNE
jgi:hypothetical protein